MITRLLVLTLLCSCSSHMTSWNDERSSTDLALEELRLELSDLRHTLGGTKIDLQLMDEKIKGQETLLKSQIGTKVQGKGADLSIQLTSLERKLGDLQKNQERLAQDLKQLTLHANQTSTTFTQHQDKFRHLEQEIAAQNRKLEEVVKLKGTLTSLSQVLKERASGDNAPLKKYKVKSGDSLEKIAKSHNTTIEALKKLNDLDSDRIVLGQELKLPNHE